MKIFPGQVFTAKHFDQFTESFKIHMFVCVYTSALNEKDRSGSNIEGLLITSKESNNCMIPLCKNNEKWLEKDSWVDVAAVMRFRITDINDIIGSVSSESFSEIISRRSEISARELHQCLRSLMNMSKYEVKYKEKINGKNN